MEFKSDLEIDVENKIKKRLNALQFDIGLQGSL